MKTQESNYGAMTLDEKMALMLSNQDKLVRHFKLYRHSKNNPDGPDAPDDIGEEDRRMLREILEQTNGISRSIDRREFSPEQNAALRRIENAVDKALRDFHNAGYQKLKETIEKIGQAVDDLKAEKQESVVRHHHRHTIDDIAGKVFGTFVALVVGLLGSIILNVVQLHNNGKFRDNDLKYRFIQMAGGATPEIIMKLRDAFEFHRDKEMIRSVRRQVEEYERLVKQEAENAAKARLNAAEAERLKQQAETVKGGAVKEGSAKEKK